MSKGKHHAKKRKTPAENSAQFFRTIAKTGKWRGKKF